jgi:DNA-binding transcriptional MocR family regulator
LACVVADEQQLLAALGGRWAEGSGPLYERLASAIRAAIARGELPVGSSLPAERRLATVVGVSRTTAVTAYARLVDAGVVVRRQGAGTRVVGGANPGSLRAARLGRIGRSAVIRSLIEGAGDSVDLTAAALPMNPVLDRALLTGVAEDMLEPRHGFGYHPLGVWQLREALAAHIAGWGLPTTGDQVLVTAGAQQALALTSALFLEPGDVAVVEHATYVGTLDAVVAAGARIAGVSMDEQGVRPDDLESVTRHEGARMIYLVPTHHNPTGTTLPLLRRRAVARIARRLHVPVIEDCTHVDIELGEPPPPPIAACGEGPVLTIGSLSKIFWGGLRIGFVRADEETIGRLARLKVAADHGPSMPSQLIATAALQRAGAARAARRREVGAALARLEELLATHLPEWRWRRPDGGLSLWPDLAGVDADALAQVALRHGVAIVPGPTCTPDGGMRDRIRLPIVRDPETMELGIERLAAAWRAASQSRPAAGARLVV